MEGLGSPRIISIDKFDRGGLGSPRILAVKFARRRLGSPRISVVKFGGGGLSLSWEYPEPASVQPQ